MAARGERNIRPIQVFLDTRRFIETPEPDPFGGGAKDFFQGRDAAFAQHKEELTNKIGRIAANLVRMRRKADFVAVTQQDVALAKSHRPLRSLFTAANNFALVGATRNGEMLFQATTRSLNRLAKVIEEKAEASPRIVLNERKGAAEPRVSRVRSEVGGIKDIRLYTPSDRLSFSAKEAVEWFRHPDAIGGYLVELFRPDREVEPEAVAALVEELKSGFEGLGGGVLVRPFLPSRQTFQFGTPSPTCTVQLLTQSIRQIDLPFLSDGRGLEISESGVTDEIREAEASLDIARHDALLQMLSTKALVRSVDLPLRLETTPETHVQPSGRATIAVPSIDVDYPVVGVIDGGVASAGEVGAWVAGKADLVPESDRDERHGTGIASLICSGSLLNPLVRGIEPTGCKVFDLDLFPEQTHRSRYYRDAEDLFDTLEEKVLVAKTQFGVRVFNLSFALGARGGQTTYSATADRLDRIARLNDVIFVVAAGNLKPPRSPWPAEASAAVAMLAAIPGQDQGISAPSDHLLGLTVGAINPSDVPGHQEECPTTYTRRGPGVGGARKPELVHVGGAGTNPRQHTGLTVATPSGDKRSVAGTSYAAPIVAATIATLDQRLAHRGRRETLLALPVHRARRPAAFEKPLLRPIARDFVGFGIAPTADEILVDEEHSVTLVFSEVLHDRQELAFTFAWPPSLVTDGCCRGRIDLTLCYTPPVDPAHHEEAMRVQLEASVQQEDWDDDGVVSWLPRLEYDGTDIVQNLSRSEREQIRAGLKWSPIKRYKASMPKGRGKSSNWRLVLSSLVRGGALFPPDGVPFSLVLTLTDSAKDDAKPIREEVRLNLQQQGLQLADITVAHRVRARGV